MPEPTIPTLRYLSPGPAPDCPECPESADDEGYFSWGSCTACQCPLGGMRYAAHAVLSDHTYDHIDVCADCLLVIAGNDDTDRLQPLLDSYP